MGDALNSIDVVIDADMSEPKDYYFAYRDRAMFLAHVKAIRERDKCLGKLRNRYGQQNNNKA